MKSSIFVAASAAMLAMASPVQLEKRAYETSWVVVEYTVTVTGTETGPSVKPTLPFGGGQKQRPQDTTSSVQDTHTDTPTSPPVVVVTVTAPGADPEVTTQTEEPTSVYSDVEPTVTAAPAGTENPTTAEDFISAALSQHNIHRSNHSAPDVTWSDKLAGYAANTAATCVFKHDMDQGEKGYGQNLAAWGQSSGAHELGETGAVKMAITNFWYNGEFNSYPPSFYTPAGPDMNSFDSWGHFSEMLWKGVTEIGCVSQFCEAGTMYKIDAWYTVCNYGPQGNVGGGYYDNVLKPLGKSVVTA
ncbi:PR-1-like protein [Hypoxylon cercidicola]|nr:PR-1-like protein [Hypoxylon cercidicola]